MKTKYLIRFLNRAVQFDADLELPDVFSIAVLLGRLISDEFLLNVLMPKNMFDLQVVK